MTLQKKLNFGFILLPILLLVAGGWSYYRFNTLSRDVQALLDEDYVSIHAAMTMTRALERMDSAALLFLSGDDSTARAILKAAEPRFAAALDTAGRNRTLPGEGKLIEGIERDIAAFRAALDDFFQAPSPDRYRRDVQPRFEAAMHSIEALRLANADAMYATALSLSESARRAGLPATIFIIAAVLFTLLFAWMTHLYIVAPLRQLLARVRRWRETGRFEPPEIETGDEIEQLAAELKEISILHPRDDRR